MGKHQVESKINESVSDRVLLDNLFNFYTSKYSNVSIEETEKRFLIEVGSLVDRGELTTSVAQGFLDEMGIEGDIPKKKVSSSRSYDDGCGRSSLRSSC